VFDFLGTVIMGPLYWIISVILVGFHRAFATVLGAENGWAWALAIMGLTVTIRAALIPLFVKQIKSSRNMQLIQPKVKELQKKYGHDRERLAQETMQLYRESNTNPFASCLPLIVQMPIFLALFRLLNLASRGEQRGILSAADVDHLSNAQIFGANLSDTFTSTPDVTVKVLAGILVVAMTATTFLTQRQLMSKNMPADAMSGPYAQQQKLLLYVLPVVFAVGGIAFPIGVLLYWTTSNLWTMGQQFYVIRSNPAPGTPAFEAKQERDRKRGRTVTEDPLKALAAESETPEPPRRQQPKKQSREQRKKQSKPQDKSGPAEADPNAADDTDSDQG